MAWVCMTESVLPSTALLSCAFVLYCAHAMLRCCAAVLLCCKAGCYAWLGYGDAMRLEGAKKQKGLDQKLDQALLVQSY